MNLSRYQPRVILYANFNPSDNNFETCLLKIKLIFPHIVSIDTSFIHLCLEWHNLRVLKMHFSLVYFYQKEKTLWFPLGIYMPHFLQAFTSRCHSVAANALWVYVHTCTVCMVTWSEATAGLQVPCSITLCLGPLRRALFMNCCCATDQQAQYTQLCPALLMVILEIWIQVFLYGDGSYQRNQFFRSQSSIF